MVDTAWSPRGVGAAQLADQHLELLCDLMCPTDTQAYTGSFLTLSFIRRLPL
jgi:hypothetical protein